MAFDLVLGECTDGLFGVGGWAFCFGDGCCCCCWWCWGEGVSGSGEFLILGRLAGTGGPGCFFLESLPWGETEGVWRAGLLWLNSSSRPSLGGGDGNSYVSDLDNQFVYMIRYKDDF